MERLFININKVMIVGKEGAALLGEAVTAMDKTMETISNDTEKLRSILSSNFESNKGDQYQKMVKYCTELSKQLVIVSKDLNKMQHQVAEYQVRIFGYEEQKREAARPRVNEADQFKLDATDDKMYFEIDSMTRVQNALVEYCEETIRNFQDLVTRKNEMSSFWLPSDPQYQTFSRFIDEVQSTIMKHLQVFINYAQFLKSMIVKFHHSGAN